MGVNRRERVVYNDPVSIDEREIIASDCVAGMQLSLPALVDDMHDAANLAYNAHPDRLFIVGSDMEIIFRSEPGPRGFDLDGFAASLAELTGNAEPSED